MSSSQKSSVISFVYKEVKKLSDQLQAKEPHKHRLQNHSFRISKETAKSSNYLISIYMKGGFIGVNARLNQDIFDLTSVTHKIVMAYYHF